VPDLLGASPIVSALTVGALIVVLAVVQSLFGVGLLVFGTPTLLLLACRSTGSSSCCCRARSS
jgi:hypothetical protein